MTIHPEIAKILATLPAPDGSPLDPAAMRAGEAAQVAPLEERLPLHAVEDLTAATPSGDVPVRIYTPVEADTYGLLVYFHGGAFFLGSLDTHDHVARSLARETGHKVISVGYRLAPEAAFPAGLDDCYGVVRWAAEQGDEPGAGTERTSPSPATARAATSSPPSPRRPTTTGSLRSRTRSCSTRRWTWTSTSTATPRCGRTLKATVWRRRACCRSTPSTSRAGRIRRIPSSPPSSARTSPACRRHWSSRPSTTRCATRANSTAGACAEAGVDTTVSRYEGANHGFVQNFSWIPEFYRAFEETGEFLNAGAPRNDGARRCPSAGLPVGPVRSVQLLHRRPGAGHRRHRDRLVAGRRHGACAGGDRPADRGRPLDPADPRPHRPPRRRARPVGAHRPARAGGDPRGRRSAAALAPRPRRRVPGRPGAVPGRPRRRGEAD